MLIKYINEINGADGADKWENYHVVMVPIMSLPIYRAKTMRR
jgi:hypothetical protein